eukprot:gene159-237_t
MGGTFIDAVALRNDGQIASLKHPRAGGGLAEMVVEALDRLRAQAGIGAGDVERVVHGSTVVTNLLLELNEPPVALVLTRVEHLVDDIFLLEEFAEQFRLLDRDRTAARRQNSSRSDISEHSLNGMANPPCRCVHHVSEHPSTISP